MRLPLRRPHALAPARGVRRDDHDDEGTLDAEEAAAAAAGENVKEEVDALMARTLIDMKLNLLSSGPSSHWAH